MTGQFTLKVFRGVPGEQYWEEFELELTPFLNLTTALLLVQKNPVNKAKQKVTPVAWEQGCLEEVCGSCTVLVNGRPRQGCTALVHKILEETGGSVITVAPMSKFPLIKDLVVNRDQMFESLKKVHAWVDVDDSFDRGFGPKISPSIQDVRYELSTCMTCGCCLEACPQINQHTKFMGAAAISQVRLFNAEPTGKLQGEERLRSLMEEGGIADCGNAQNCVAVCPKNIPLTDSIALMQREVNKQAIKDLFSVPDA
ncbi:MAG: succinate dehydrogenase iron-sulfur subunit [Verrucomicrobia bacterium]|nr:succinate dehydrogenase iron-sulfur subunit [Verrucomicrobiota bacterium]